MQDLSMIPRWGRCEKIIGTHPELHHYTTARGLEGIIRTNTLWATYFKELNDAKELQMARLPLVEEISSAFFILLKERQKHSLRVRRAKKSESLISVAKKLAIDFVNSHHIIAFDGTGFGKSPFADAFVCSFCSHIGDHDYERVNGLLSQWRGYGGAEHEGRFAIVFDTGGLDELLSREWKAHFWLKLDLDEVRYFYGRESIKNFIPDFRRYSEAQLDALLIGNPIHDDEWLKGFFDASTLLKHRGFREEREVRIVAIPQSEAAYSQRGIADRMKHYAPFKPEHVVNGTKRHIALFDGLKESLPINRVIVGPGRNTSDALRFAKKLAGNKFEVVMSETPYIA